MKRRSFLELMTMAGAALGPGSRLAPTQSTPEPPARRVYLANQSMVGELGTKTGVSEVRAQEIGRRLWIEDPSCPRDMIYAFDTKSLPPEIYKLLEEQQQRDYAAFVAKLNSQMYG